MGAVAGISSGATRECMHAVTRRRRPLPPRMAREGGGGVCVGGTRFEEDLEGDASIPGENRERSLLFLLFLSSVTH